ncbi:MAG: polyprenol monophosphomannose synthase [Euryarchaeota archaeon]|nr:polyprenol monophosphomannose synthase [Euryarchaeota archaeon]MDE1837248.1 polyprenol monophosphomannose synthase [Euryarchaeota archaeon]MDE1881619.1 polyprenol monophosphomannose synthase [Euryarchaeota archaeon]MDE2045148.1 polyprenol monophosphomannose synthase [Thermoplasmata archaeon]
MDAREAKPVRVARAIQAPRLASPGAPPTASASLQHPTRASTPASMMFDDLTEVPVDVTVVVPTFNERESIAPLVRALEAVLNPLPYRTEIVVVDDASPDGTAEVVRRLPTRVPTRIIVRHHDKGLASAVLTGVSAAKGRVCLVMDADGSHPPDMAPALIETVLEGRAEMVLASRYAPGGTTDQGWPSARRLMSRVATWLARPLTSVHDPMTGFFALDSRILSRGDLSPIGYKIGLEFLVRCRPHPVLEVPFVFRDRRVGNSKMSFKEVFRYARHLSRLYLDRMEGKFGPYIPSPDVPPGGEKTASPGPTL